MSSTKKMIDDKASLLKGREINPARSVGQAGISGDADWGNGGATVCMHGSIAGADKN